MKEAILLTDGYKLDHRRQYPENTEYVYSNWTPRSCHYYPEATEGAVVFGIQYFIKEYLMKQFQQDFFNKPKDVAVAEFKRRVDTFLGPNNVGTKHIEELHDLGYLPIRIKALPEGTLCPIRVPALTFINTHPDFFWLTNYFETLISTTLWLPMTSATTARLYKKELSETIPAIAGLEEYYNADADKELIAATIPATEHSVMCAGGKEDELETFRRLITEIYPTGFVSIVSDTWDFWKVMTEYLPKLKDEILARDGRLVIRPDSGDPVHIIAGYKQGDFENWQEQTEAQNKMGSTAVWVGAYEVLWGIFGGTINEKGYKVLNPKVGIIYGDSITLERQKEIYKRLEERGFAATNLVLGVGSYTYQYKSRDSLGFAMKATWCQVNGEGREIFKDPKTDDGTKKSLKGLICVQSDGDRYIAEDQVTKEQEDKSCLQTVFEDGKLVKEWSLRQIRDNVNNSIVLED